MNPEDWADAPTYEEFAQRELDRERDVAQANAVAEGFEAETGQKIMLPRHIYDAMLARGIRPDLVDVIEPMKPSYFNVALAEAHCGMLTVGRR